MFREVLKSKIHRATVTDLSVDYVGSISIDLALMQKANIIVGEKVDVFNIHNGARFSTYVIEAPYGSGEVNINGAAARLARKGDRIIIVAYGLASDEELKDFQASIVHVNSQNQIID